MFAYKLNSLLNVTAAMNYYFSCVYSTVIYCVAVWGAALEASCREKNHFASREVIKISFKLFFAGPPCIFRAAIHSKK